MPEGFENAGVTAVIAFLVIKECFRLIRYLVERRNGNGNGKKSISSILANQQDIIDKLLIKIKDIHFWLSKEDGDGIKLIYFKQGFVTTMKEMVILMRKQVKLTEESLQRIEEKIDKE